ncbi:G-protein coupled receptor 157-like [Dendronephthya gigantea]|uniref:G-protein coupled receptor 157-like n=1 Tax=Dendronephthya gigantea TaxID=151771 RepID=UPI00106A8744|nr:G-protein coupled receptor 157-like [Dendronephthya gigantea]
MTSTDFLSAASNISGVWHQTQTATPACQIEGFIIIFSMTSSFFWTSCLTIHLYLIIMNKNHLISTSKKMFIFHAVGWGLPLILAFIALGGNALGPSPALNKNESYIKLTTGGWCWIKDFHDDRKTLAWTMMTSKFWELSSYLLITVLCLTIFLTLRFKIQETDSIGEDTLAEARKVERRMMFIPIAFILLRIWGTVRYFAFLSTLSVRTSVLKNIPLYAMQGLGDSGQGFANSIFFGISNKRVFEYWKYVITGFFHGFLCYKSDSEDSERTPIIYSLNVDQKERANNC